MSKEKIVNKLMLLLLLALTSAAPATAGKLSIQGHLTNGGVSMNGDHTVAFKFYDASTNGNLLWTEQDTITVASYLFTATLGKNMSIPLTVFAGQEAWLETTIDGSTLSPRTAFYPQPMPSGTDNLWTTNGADVWRAGGKVGIGVTTPEATLDIDGYINSTSGNLSLHNGRCGFSNDGTDLIMGVTTPGTARAMVDNNGTLILDYGGDFPNGVRIDGNLNVVGTKCREVNDLKYGKLYFNAIESANALFTLEGEAKMANGIAHVLLDPKWLAGVTIDTKHPMQVWVTFYGQHGDYYIQRANSNNGFKVIDPAHSNVTFGWKVEARQKGYEDRYMDNPLPH